MSIPAGDQVFALLGAGNHDPSVFEEPDRLEERARLARLTGDGAAAERELREAHRLYEAIGATGHAGRLAKELAAS